MFPMTYPESANCRIFYNLPQLPHLFGGGVGKFFPGISGLFSLRPRHVNSTIGMCVVYLLVLRDDVQKSNFRTRARCTGFSASALPRSTRQGKVEVHDLMCRTWNTPQLSTRDRSSLYLRLREIQRIMGGSSVTPSATSQAPAKGGYRP